MKRVCVILALGLVLMGCASSRQGVAHLGDAILEATTGLEFGAAGPFSNLVDELPPAKQGTQRQAPSRNETMSGTKSD